MVMDRLTDEVGQESPWTMMFATTVARAGSREQGLVDCSGKKRTEGYLKQD